MAFLFLHRGVNFFCVTFLYGGVNNFWSSEKIDQMLKFLRPTKSNQPIKIRKSFLIKKFFFAVFLKKVSNICSVESQQTNITNVPRGTLKQTK